MARSRMTELEEAVLNAADTWRDVESWSDTVDFHALQALMDAVDARRAEIARQDVSAKHVYLRTDAGPAEVAAAQAAMLNRAGWRSLIYDALNRVGPRSDRELEYFAPRLAVQYGLKPEGATHQTISSARNSLVRCRLVAADGFTVIDGRKHTRWRAVPQVVVPG